MHSSRMRTARSLTVFHSIGGGRSAQPPECRTPLNADPFQDADFLDADPQMQTPLDADPPWMQTPLDADPPWMQTP